MRPAVLFLFLTCCSHAGPAVRAEEASGSGNVVSPVTGAARVRVDRSPARSCFQSHAPWSPATDIRSDVAIVYGVDDSFASRTAEWKRQGYVTHMMTGSAWGEYEDYVQGRFDGTSHTTEGQVDREGNTIWHHEGVPYMVPTPSYVAFLKSLTRRAIDGGAEGLHLEEPEFWARAGYSQGFQKLWEKEYGERWQRPDSSPDAFWRAGLLKYLLYKRTLEEVLGDAKDYAARKGRRVQCFVPTHSLVNYSQWGIVSPESSLMDLASCDGYIAQVWTGTARSPNFYRGVRRERTFDTAYLEYASMHSMVAPTGRTVYFLADPVEDDPNHSWDDYRANYERVVAASLLFPDVVHYEVMPWPDRVMTGHYPAGTYLPDDPTSKITIPPSYASELMTVVNTLHEMEKGPVRWESGTTGVAVLLSDTMMFQRGNPWEWEAEFSDYYGLALPPLKAGLPLQSVILERLADGGALEDVRVLLASYEHMKPLSRNYNEELARWVKNGGVLLYFGDDSDRFHGARAWWNDDGQKPGRSARDDLFEQMGLAADLRPGRYRVGDGTLIFSRDTARSLAKEPDGADRVMAAVQQGLDAAALPLRTSGHLLLERGRRLVVGAVLDENPSTTPLRLKGSYVNLFSPDLDIVQDPGFSAGEVFLLRRVDQAPENGLEVLGSNLRVEEISEKSPGVWRLFLRGPAPVKQGLVRLALPEEPASAEIGDGTGAAAGVEWAPASRTALLSFPNRPGGVELILRTAASTNLPAR